MACNHDNSLSQEKRGQTLAVIMSCLLASGASLAFGDEDRIATGAEGSAHLSQTSDGESGGGHAKADTRANAQLGVRSAEAGTRAESGTSAQGVARTSLEADDAVSAAESGAAEMAGAVESIEGPETDADLVGSATGAAAAAGDVQSGDAVDAALRSTLKGEIAGSINSTVQEDVRDSIQADLVTDITRALPLPGRN